MFWFLWLVWEKFIKNPDKTNMFDIGKTVVIKIFTVLFVWAMLMKVPAVEIFRYTIDPIMSLGAGFGKWILVETRNDNYILQNSKLPKFNCEDIKIDKKVIDMLSVNNVSTNNDNLDTLKNLICITREYSNTYNTGLNLGFKIVHRGFIGLASGFGSKKVIDNSSMFTSLIPEKITSTIVIVVIGIVKLLLFYGAFINFIYIILGLGISIAFLYVAFTFITLVLDIVIQLALVAVMMPITIGSFAFSGNDMVDLKGKLANQLFWNVLKISFRLIGIAISISISMFLLTELMSYKFDNSNTLQTLYDVLINKQNLGQSVLQTVGLNTASLELVKILINPGMFVAILLTTLISWMLLTESISMSDKFSSALYSGVGDDNVFKGIQAILKSTFVFVRSRVKRDIIGYRKFTKKINGLDKKFNIINDGLSNLKVKQLEKEVFEDGNLEKLDKLPAAILVKHYENMKFGNNEDETSISNNSNKSDNLSKTDNKKGVNNNRIVNPDIEIQKMLYIENKFLNDKFIMVPEYVSLSENDKESLSDILLESNLKKLDITNPKIVEFANVIQKDADKYFPITSSNNTENYSNILLQMNDEFLKEQVITLNVSDPKYLNNTDLKNKFKNFVENGNDLKDKELAELYEKYKDKIFIEQNLKKEKLKQLRLNRKKYRINKKVLDVLDTKKVVETIKKEELEELQNEIDALDIMSPPAKRFLLRRKLKKLKQEIEDIKEKDNFQLEDEYENIVSNWKNNKKKKSKINPLKTI